MPLFCVKNVVLGLHQLLPLLTQLGTCSWTAMISPKIRRCFGLSASISPSRNFLRPGKPLFCEGMQQDGGLAWIRLSQSRITTLFSSLGFTIRKFPTVSVSPSTAPKAPIARNRVAPINRPEFAGTSQRKSDSSHKQNACCKHQDGDSLGA
jgi:hypothetical protein